MPENLAKVVTREFIEKAINEIVSQHLQLIPSTKFDIVYKGGRYPPKEVVRMAARLQGILTWETYRLSGGESTNRHLRDKGFDVQPKPNNLRYFIGGAAWNGSEDQTARFLKDGVWENGYEDRFIDEVSEVPTGSLIAIKSSFAKGKDSILRIKAIGTVTANSGDGNQLSVEWYEGVTPFDLVGLGSYRQTFHEVTDPRDIDAIFYIDKDADIDIQEEEKIMEMNHPLNTILYGPPGTGKTYHTIDRALQIIDPKYYDENLHNRFKLNQRFRELLIKDWSSPIGQIGFITFHQSLSYEDFIEGIKPELIEAGNDEDSDMLTYQIKDGVFKLLAQKATWRSGNFDQIIEAFKSDYNELENKTPLTISSKYTTFDVAYRGTTVFYVRPHNSKKENAWYPASISNLRKVYETGEYEGVYNPTYTREILEYLRRNKGLIQPSTIADKKPNPHVLIIDEINRGNISQIFGELITLIEDDKRQGAKEELTVTLPYSKKSFSVPKNLFILGTMNTADRSVEALDTALRRRFSFEEMNPKPELLSPVDMLCNFWNLEEHLDLTYTQWMEEPFLSRTNAFYDFVGITREKENEILDEEYYDSRKHWLPSDVDFLKPTDFTGVNLEDLLTIINKRLERLLSKDHQIGHAFFINVFSYHELANVFHQKVIPQLQEYFYGDYGKIGLVLGKGFIEQANSIEDENVFADFYDIDTERVEKPIYHLRNISKMNPEDFKVAIRVLMRSTKELSNEA